MCVIIFLIGLVWGYTFRLVYCLLTDKDIPIFKRKHEIERLEKEIIRLKKL